ACTCGFGVTVLGAIFLPRWRQTTSSKTSRTSSTCSSAPSTASTGDGPISWPRPAGAAAAPRVAPARAALGAPLGGVAELVDDGAGFGLAFVVALDRQPVPAQAD